MNDGKQCDFDNSIEYIILQTLYDKNIRAHKLYTNKIICRATSRDLEGKIIAKKLTVSERSKLIDYLNIDLPRAIISVYFLKDAKLYFDNIGEASTNMCFALSTQLIQEIDNVGELDRIRTQHCQALAKHVVDKIIDFNATIESRISTAF